MLEIAGGILIALLVVFLILRGWKTLPISPRHGYALLIVALVIIAIIVLR
jgi:hypothetical protein